jgi:hypothetical protein
MSELFSYQNKSISISAITSSGVYTIVLDTTGSVFFPGNIYVSQSIYAPSSIFVSSSYAGTASVLLGSIVSSSYAGTASVLLGSVQTSSYSTNSSNTINVYNVRAYGATGNGVSDDTVAIQNAINACFSGSGGTVYFPNGIYKIAGALQTNVAGANPNSQLYIPQLNSLTSASLRTHITFQGETRPNFTPSTAAFPSIDLIPSLKGTILLSTITGSGAGSSVLGGTDNLAAIGSTFNYTGASVKDLTILVGQDISGSLIGGINFRDLAQSDFENVAVYSNVSFPSSSRPIREIGGILTAKNGGDASNYLKNVQAAGFKYGVVVGEHALLEQVQAANCEYGFVFTAAGYATTATRLLGNWNRNYIYFPTSSILGYTQNGTIGATTNIHQFAAEVVTGSGKWYDVQYFVVDPGNLAAGNAYYDVYAVGGGAHNSASFIAEQGGNNFNLIPSISPNSIMQSGSYVLSLKNTQDYLTLSSGSSSLFRVGASGSVGINIISTPQNLLQVGDYQVLNSQVRIAGLEMQSMGLNNCFIGDNVYYSGSGGATFYRRTTSPNAFASYIFFGNLGDIQLRHATSDNVAPITDGASGVGRVSFKTKWTGEVGIGGDIQAGSFTGSALYMGISGSFYLGTNGQIAGNQKLYVSGNSVFTDSVIITGSLTVTGSGLFVTGSTSLTGPFTVTGSSLISGSTNITGSFSVSGSSIFKGSSTVSGTVSISSISSNYGLSHVVSNTSTTVTAIADTSYYNASGSQFVVGKTNYNYSTYKSIGANDAILFNLSNSSGSIVIANDYPSGSIILAAGGSSTSNLRITPAGNTLLNTSTDSGYTLDVSGSIRTTLSLIVTGSQRLSGSFYMTGSIFNSPSGTFILPLTASTLSVIPTGSAFFSGSFLCIWNGSRYLTTSLG